MSSTSKLLRTAIGIGALATMAAACGGGSSGGGQPDTVSPAAAGGGSALSLTTHSSPLGTYLTDGNGRTVYVFSADRGMTSSCRGACAREWPPVTTSGAPTASGKVQSSMLGTDKRSGGVTQVTYAGHPLYYFADDESAGDMKGEGEDDFGGTWSAVAPSGTPISASSPSSSPTSSGSGSSGGGGAWG
jgi:predicted lipoprotein with Yx(FWY)xxD motif